MAHSIAGGNVRPGCNGKRASRCNNPVASDDHRAVVQWRILEEDVQYESSAYACVNDITGFHNLLERIFAGKDNERTSPVFAHHSAGFGDFLGCFSINVRRLGYSQKTVCQVPPFAGESGAAAQSYQEVTDFWLKNHHKGNDSHVEHSLQDG